MEAFVHSIETAGALDGPGLRYVLFLKSCPFRCKFCHNPDTWAVSGGEKKSLVDIVNDIQKYETFFKFTNGGVTVSGGEPLMQAEFVANLFKILKSKAIHTCLDTCGYADIKNQDVISCIENSDLIMLDIKHLENSVHKYLTGKENLKTLAFLNELERLNKRVWIRIVLLHTISDSAKYANMLADFLSEFKCVELVELLPYHTLGVSKWKELGLIYEFENMKAPSEANIVAFEEILNKKSIKTLRRK